MTWTRDEEQVIHPPGKPFCHHYPTISQRTWPKFDRYLGDRELDHDLARKNFWFPSRTVDGYDRIVVPATSDQPGNLYWQARLIDTIPGTGSIRRWESPHGISRGNAVCLVWPRLKGARAVVCEGPMDALAAADLGFIAIGLMGVTPAVEVLDLTARLLRGTMVFVVMDMGAEAEMADNKVYLAHRGLDATLINPYPHKDLAAMSREVRRVFLPKG